MIIFAEGPVSKVAISYTGRVVIPKKMRELANIEKGNVIFLKKELPGYVLLITNIERNEKHILAENCKLKDVSPELADYYNRHKISSSITDKVKYYLKHGKKSYEGHNEGFSLVEDNYRIFIPKGFREFASIEDDRKKWGAEVLLVFERMDRIIQLWDIRFFNKLKSKLYKDLFGDSFEHEYFQSRKKIYNKKT